MAANGESSEVIATVDVGRTEVVVWWTNVRPERTASMARNCGAWTISRKDLQTIETVTAGKICLASPAARKFLGLNMLDDRRFLHPGATLAGVLGEQSRMNAIAETSVSQSSAKPLRWPTSPSPLNLSKARQETAPKPVQKALAIANWLVGLAEFWESMEQVRLARPMLRKHDGPNLRPLPLVIDSAHHPEPPHKAMTLPFDV